MVAEVKAAAKDGDSLGGVVRRCSPTVLPSGWQPRSTGTENSTHSWRRPLMSIQAVKASSSGGVSRSPRAGLRRHTRHLLRRVGSPQSGGYRRDTVRAGGIEGGMSIGGTDQRSVAMKPLATLEPPDPGTVDVVSKEPAKKLQERTDVHGRCRPWAWSAER